MTVRGKLTLPGDLTLPPFNSPPTGPLTTTPKQNFTAVSMLMFRYYTDPEVVAELIPDFLEIDERPIVRAGFYEYGMTKNGPYLEYMMFVRVKYEGAYYQYAPHIYTSTVSPLISGREIIGTPKAIAAIEFNPLGQTASGLVTGKLERPAGFTIATGITSVQNMIGRVGDETTDEVLAYEREDHDLYVRPNPLDPMTPWLFSGRGVLISGYVWKVHGKLGLTGISDVDPLHKMPVVEPINAFLVTEGATEIQVNPAPVPQLSADASAMRDTAASNATGI